MQHLGENYQKLHEHPLCRLPEKLSDAGEQLGRYPQILCSPAMSSPLELIAASGYFVKWMEDIRLIKQCLLVRSGYIEFFELLEKALGRMRSKTPTGSALPQTVEIMMLPETKALAETVFQMGRAIYVETRPPGSQNASACLERLELSFRRCFIAGT